jgi:ribosomal protein L13E
LSSGSKPKKAKDKKKPGVAKEAEGEVQKLEKAVKKEAKKVESAVIQPRPALIRPSGRAPEAMIMARHGGETISRRGKGFSLGELSNADLPRGMAARWGVGVDIRRRSVIEGNVTTLKGWRSHATKAAPARREAKVIEEKVEEAVKEVEKGAKAVEKEAAKAEKAVKRGAKKAGREVKAKVERKPRTKKKKEES